MVRPERFELSKMSLSVSVVSVVPSQKSITYRHTRSVLTSRFYPLRGPKLVQTKTFEVTQST
jgi:hypothetical protein